MSQKDKQVALLIGAAVGIAVLTKVEKKAAAALGIGALGLAILNQLV